MAEKIAILGLQSFQPARECHIFMLQEGLIELFKKRNTVAMVIDSDDIV